jgi:hypothetical protein
MPDPARLFQPQAAIASSAYIRASSTKCSAACRLEGDDVRRANAASDIAPNQFGIVGQLWLMNARRQLGEQFGCRD